MTSLDRFCEQHDEATRVAQFPADQPCGVIARTYGAQVGATPQFIAGRMFFLRPGHPRQRYVILRSETPGEVDVVRYRP